VIFAALAVAGFLVGLVAASLRRPVAPSGQVPEQVWTPNRRWVVERRDMADVGWWWNAE